MKAKEHLYNLKENFKGKGSSIEDKTDFHLMYMLDEARSVLIGRKIQNKNSINSMIQHIDLEPTKAN